MCVKNTEEWVTEPMMSTIFQVGCDFTQDGVSRCGSGAILDVRESKVGEDE